MNIEISSFTIITSDYGDSNDDFYVNLQIDISETGHFGAETFSIDVVSPARLQRIAGNENIIGRGLIITNDFNQVSIRNTLDTLIKGVHSESWEQVINELEKYLKHI